MKYNPIALMYLGFAYLLFPTFLCDSVAEIKSGLCNPYYASIKVSKANSHVGPGKNYKIKFEYILKGLPVMIIAKFDNWRKIKDPDGDCGWIHKSLLSSKRFVISRSEDIFPIMSSSNDSSSSSSSSVVAKVKKNVVMELRLVRGNWCKIELNCAGGKIAGWVKRQYIFGVMDDEN